MTLIIADNIDDRLDFRGYLRKNGILAAAPPPSDFEAAVMSGKSEVIIFICPFRPSLAAVAPPDKICIAVGTGASSNNSYMLGFDDPFDPELLEFLKDIEEKAVRQRVGDLVRRDGKLYCAGYELRLTPAERAIVDHLMLRGASGCCDLAAVCLDTVFPGSDSRERRNIAALVSRINSKATDVSGRRLIVFESGKYVLCTYDG